MAGTINGQEVVGWAMKRRLARVCEFSEPAPEEPKLEQSAAGPLSKVVEPPRLLADRVSKLAVMDVVVADANDLGREP